MHNYAQLRVGVPSERTLARWSKERRVRYQQENYNTLSRENRLLKWAMRELVEYCEETIKPGTVPSWERFRRKLVRARGML